MKNKKQDGNLCVMCHEKLMVIKVFLTNGFDSLELCVCENPACSNFSLLCLPEGAIREEVKE